MTTTNYNNNNVYMNVRTKCTDSSDPPHQCRFFRPDVPWGRSVRKLALTREACMLSFAYLQAAISHGFIFKAYTVSTFSSETFSGSVVLAQSQLRSMRRLLHILQTPKHTLQVNSSNDYN